MSSKDELLSELLQLPESDRAEFAYELLKSLDTDAHVDAASEWARELERRADEALSGRVKLSPAGDVLRELDAKYSRRG